MIDYNIHRFVILNDYTSVVINISVKNTDTIFIMSNDITFVIWSKNTIGQYILSYFFMSTTFVFVDSLSA